MHDGEHGACDEVDWQARQGEGGRGRSVAEWREEKGGLGELGSDGSVSVVHVLGIYILFLRVPGQDPMHVEDN